MIIIPRPKHLRVVEDIKASKNIELDKSFYAMKPLFAGSRLFILREIKQI